MTDSKTPFKSASLHLGEDSTLDLMQKFQFCQLVTSKNHQMGAERGCSLNGASSSHSAATQFPLIVPNWSSAACFESAKNWAVPVVSGAISKSEISDVQERRIRSVCPVKKPVVEISSNGNLNNRLVYDTPPTSSVLPFNDSLRKNIQFRSLGINKNHLEGNEKGQNSVNDERSSSNTIDFPCVAQSSSLNSNYGIEERCIEKAHFVDKMVDDTSMKGNSNMCFNDSLLHNLKNCNLSELGFLDDHETSIEKGLNLVGGSSSCYNLMGSSASQGNELFESPTSAVTTDRILQLQRRGVHEREIGIVGSLQTPAVENDPLRFAHCLLEEFCGLNGEYGGSSSVSGWQTSDHLNGRQDSDERSTMTQSRGNLEDLTDRVLMNYSGFQMKDPSLLKYLHTDNIPGMAMNQMGCHYLQGILATKDLVATKMILDGTLPFIVEVMIHQFGNFVFQRLLESCNEYQIEVIVNEVTKNKVVLINVANAKHGTRSIQKLVKVTRRSPSLLVEVTKALCPGLVSLMNSPHGSHVIRCLSHIQSSHNSLLYDAIKEQCLDVATNEGGCVALKTCIDNSKSPERELLLEKISKHSVFLSQDPFGNYVVQHILALEIPSITDQIIDKLKGHYVRLSQQKCGSHVVEQCLKSSRADSVIWELLTSEKLGELARDQCGNYVIQTALKIALKTETAKDIHLLRSLIDSLMAHSQSLEFHRIGRNVFKLVNDICNKRHWTSQKHPTLIDTPLS